MSRSGGCLFFGSGKFRNFYKNFPASVSYGRVPIGPSSIVVSTPRCGRGDTGSIPVLGSDK
ncbi:unnamed protein product [Onchocerca flexuosa]|uniref:Uncharacterized protein n=1 Tax=Onchocerca flexuosa TaxID=387005 RepID=A0A3P8D0Y8_9BILA|nr:unnamed protein product [Onchocerca flexuosa]